MKITVFWDVVPCSLIEIDESFRCGFYHHYQGDVSKNL
jgi:hypothetical protein